MGCCCSGGVGGGFEYVKVKEESGEEQKFSLCRDAHLKHSVTTKACEALAQLPSFMDLYSGYVPFSLSFSVLYVFVDCLERFRI